MTEAKVHQLFGLSDGWWVVHNDSATGISHAVEFRLEDIDIGASECCRAMWAVNELERIEEEVE